MDHDWDTLIELQQLFLIFVKPTVQMQATTYPTLSSVIPAYVRMFNKLRAKIGDPGTKPATIAACDGYCKT